MNTAPFWAGIIHDDNDSEDSPAYLFEGSEAQMREFFKSQFKKQEGNAMIDLKDDNFSEQPWGFSVYDLDQYRHLHIYRYERLYKAPAAGGRRSRSRRLHHPSFDIVRNHAKAFAEWYAPQNAPIIHKMRKTRKNRK